MQETLFELAHVHQYELYHGPIKTQSVIQTSFHEAVLAIDIGNLNEGVK